MRILQIFQTFNIQPDLVCKTSHLWFHANPKSPGAVKYVHIKAATLPLLLDEQCECHTMLYLQREATHKEKQKEYLVSFIVFPFTT